MINKIINYLILIKLFQQIKNIFYTPKCVMVIFGYINNWSNNKNLIISFYQLMESVGDKGIQDLLTKFS
jgi:hypothetical protein